MLYTADINYAVVFNSYETTHFHSSLAILRNSNPPFGLRRHQVKISRSHVTVLLLMEFIWHSVYTYHCLVNTVNKSHHTCVSSLGDTQAKVSCTANSVRFHFPDQHTSRYSLFITFNLIAIFILPGLTRRWIANFSNFLSMFNWRVSESSGLCVSIILARTV